jgi:hypothetical protein
MSDSLELDSLFTKTNFYDEAAYEKVEYIQLTDIQSGQYGTGSIGFNTESQMKNHVVYSESYLVLPIRANLATDGRLAVKNSLLSFIQGVQIESSSGTQICGEMISTPIINNLRLLIDSSTDFLEGNELMFFGKDKIIEQDISGAGSSVVGGTSTECTSGKGLVSESVNSLLNPTLCSRISVLQKRTVVIAGGVTSRAFIAYIPLKFVHDFFAQMSFPIINLALRITFNIAGVGNYASYNPWTIPTFPAHLSLGTTAVPAAATLPATLAAATPSAVFGTHAVTGLATDILTSMQDEFGANVTPRLILKTVYFRAREAQALHDEIQKGFSKTIVYRNTNYYTQPMAGSATGGTGDVSWPFVQGIIRPTRVWVLPVAKSTLGSASNTFPATIGPNYLSHTNIQLNGNNFYNNEMVTQYDHFREFKKQLIGASTSTACGTPISYSDWVAGINPYCFDLSRNPTVKSNNLCTLHLTTRIRDQTTKLAPAGDVELIVIVERLQTVTLQVSEGGVVVLTRQGTTD